MWQLMFSTKNNYVYEKLKDEIIEGKLRPGERIVISDLSKRYEVSPMPIREAINRLQQDGFVEVMPHVGARVSPFDLERHKELMKIRIELETLAVRKAKVDEATLARLEDLLLEMEESLKNNENKKYGKINKEFHLLIYSSSSYKILNDLIVTLWQRSEFSRGIFETMPERNRASYDEHKAMVEAIRKGDMEGAAEVLRQQKEVSTAMHLKHFESGISL